ncbi:hypothetical protein [Aeromicrobium sp.]|jgi:tartrate dehydratase beta subunit/fumarate hydratase class I family protein|uniref:hypothetical protein n=1 Tax=Aeromicrobium sp. TaxID=1871063 RepID=UPI0028B01E68|nr:hypothetical protein [Aeromicrobium sp.]
MDDHTSPPQRRDYRRVAIGALLVIVAIGLFPTTAAVLDESNEDWILPVFVAVMVALGALLWVLVPAVAGERSRIAHRVAVGGAAGLAAAVAAIIVFYALLNGYSGA